jgi:hypothetical protein
MEHDAGAESNAACLDGRSGRHRLTTAVPAEADNTLQATEQNM